jgi:KipI family sensor histidine kinase inhibitor
VLLLEPFGDSAWRARLPDAVDVRRRRALLDTLRALPVVVDAVVSEQYVLVVLARDASPDGLREVIADALGSTMDAAATREHRVHVRYDGADLAEVAQASGLSPQDVVALHAGRTYEVAAMGFLPGFAYLRSLDSRLVLPRRATPRTRVPVLSVAIAGPYTGIYPVDSPGGWHLLGVAVGFAPFDPQAGASMALGDRVRFVPGETATVASQGEAAR